MAQVTMELRNLLQSDFVLFDFEYPFDDGKMKTEIENHIIEHYWPYEIGQETPDLFKQRFKARFLSIIGYYNELYNTTLLKYDPLINEKLTESLEQLATSDHTEDTTNNATSNISSDNTQTTDMDEKTSDYPQQPIAGGDYASGEKTTNGTVKDNGTSSNTTDSTQNASGNDTTNTTYDKTIEGITGRTYQELVKAERENILRIKSMIVNELKPCFILIY